MEFNKTEKKIFKQTIDNSVLVNKIKQLEEEITRLNNYNESLAEKAAEKQMIERHRELIAEIKVEK